VYLVRL